MNSCYSLQKPAEECRSTWTVHTRACWRTGRSSSVNQQQKLRRACSCSRSICSTSFCCSAVERGCITVHLHLTAVQQPRQCPLDKLEVIAIGVVVVTARVFRHISTYDGRRVRMSRDFHLSGDRIGGPGTTGWDLGTTTRLMLGLNIRVDRERDTGAFVPL